MRRPHLFYTFRLSLNISSSKKPPWPFSPLLFSPCPIFPPSQCFLMNSNDICLLVYELTVCFPIRLPTPCEPKQSLHYSTLYSQLFAHIRYSINVCWMRCMNEWMNEHRNMVTGVLLEAALLGHASEGLSCCPLPSVSIFHTLCPPKHTPRTQTHEPVNSWPHLTKPATQNPLSQSSDVKFHPRKD